MLYNTPYFFPGLNAAANTATKASFFSKLNLGTILTNASKTLNVINQAIPLYYQAKPVISNLKSLSKITKEFTSKQPINNKNNEKKEIKNREEIKKEESTIPNPSFFI